MASASIDFSTLLRGLPPGAWVAISEAKNTVIAYAAELQAVLDKAHGQGEAEPLIVRVPEQAVNLFL